MPVAIYLTPLAFVGSVANGVWFYAIFKIARKLGVQHIHAREDDLIWAARVVAVVYIELIVITEFFRNRRPITYEPLFILDLEEEHIPKKKKQTSISRQRVYFGDTRRQDTYS